MKPKQICLQLLVFITVLFTQLNVTYAQTADNNYLVKGVVTDSTDNKPLSLTTVRIKNMNDELVNVFVTKDDGSFTFSGLAAASYKITITVIGYSAKLKIVDLTKSAAKTVDLGKISLGGQTTILTEVSIRADKPIIHRKADRIIYDLKADPESKGNNILTMMRKVPYLSLDGDDNLLLKGNSSFKVLINGKPSPSLENNLKAVLKSIPASTIERIEVITIPSSKYDAEGLTGIINIITTKRVSDGYDGTVNLNESGPTGGPGVGASFTAKSGKFGISTNEGASIDNSPTTYNSSNRQSTGTDPTTLLQQGDQNSNNKTAYFGTELSYQIDTLNLITAQFNYNGSRATDHSGQSSVLNGTAGLLEQYNFLKDGNATGHGIDAGINYEMAFKAKRNELLTFSYLFSTNLNNRYGTDNFSNEVNFSTPDFQENDNQKFTEHTLQVDFNIPVKKVNIEAGLKGILRKNTSDYEFNSFNATDNQFEFDPELSNQYTNTQNVFSAYNTYQINLNNFNINAGVRVEGTVIRANFLNTETVVDQNYFNVVPSVSISEHFKNESSVNLGFTQRIRRPGINRLNPYVDRSNPSYEITGNPNLRPVVLNDIQLGYGINKKVSVNLGLDYSFMNNLDLQVVNFDPNTQITQVTYANTGKSSSMALNFNLGYSVGVYNVSLNGNAMYLWLAGMVNGNEVNNNLLMYSTTLSNVVRLKHGWALNADFSVNSHSPTGLQGRTNGFFYSAFNFNKEIIKNKFGISGGVKNPFTKYRNVVSQTFGPDFNQTYQTNNYFRSFSVSLNYNFGGLRDGINKNKVGIENNDLAN